jgi:hypothetical protein
MIEWLAVFQAVALFFGNRAPHPVDDIGRVA